MYLLIFNHFIEFYSKLRQKTIFLSNLIFDLIALFFTWLG